MRSAVVIGASGGIGAAMVGGLEARGYRTLGTSRRAVEGMTPLDVEDEVSVEAAAASLKERLGTIHLLIYTPGFLHDASVTPERRLEHISPPAVMKSFAVNALGPMLVAKHFLPLLSHEEPAVLANLSARVGSISDNRLGGWYAYRSTKAAQNMFTRTLALECKRRAPNLVCVALHPGTVDTALSAPFQRGVPEGKLFSPERAAAQLLDVIERLRPEDSGEFFAWDGQRIDW